MTPATTTTNETTHYALQQATCIGEPLTPFAPRNAIELMTPLHVLSTGVGVYHHTPIGRYYDTKVTISGPEVHIIRFKKPLWHDYRTAPPLRHKRDVSIKLATNPLRRIDSVRRAKKRLRQLAMANAFYGRSYYSAPVFVTLTIADGVLGDPTNKDWQQREWTKYCNKISAKYPNAQYLMVEELQKRGAVHYHILYFGLGYNHMDDFKNAWPHGSVDIQRVKHKHDDILKIVNYLGKYMTKEFTTESWKQAGDRLFTCSHDLRQPKVTFDPMDVHAVLLDTPQYEVLYEGHEWHSCGTGDYANEYRVSMYCNIKQQPPCEGVATYAGHC